LPSPRSLARIRSLLPYAAKLLPMITGIAMEQPQIMRPDFSSVNRHFGELQSDNRGLRSQVEDQTAQIGRIQAAVEQLATQIEGNSREQQELAASFRSLAGLLKGLFFAILFLLVAVAALNVLILIRVTHL
jgi:septal ring factor EnvC (AmiA/AmiB activator)